MKKIKLRIIIFGFLALFILWFIIHSIIVTVDGLNDELEKTDIAVVLGNKVELDGKPSKRLQGRLDRAAELYEENYFNYIIVSGGFGKEGYDEAVVMKDYLVEKGIPEEKILLDSNGYNSLMTAENTKLIMKEMNFDSVTIITQFYHITRTKLYSLFREFFAYYKYI